MIGAWWKTGTDMVLLGMESQGVIAQRLSMFVVGGPQVQAEAQLMVTEKLIAAGEAAVMLATGVPHGKVIQGYRRKVRANARRLRRTPETGI